MDEKQRLIEKERLKEIEEGYKWGAEIEGEDYAYLALRNEDIDFLLEIARRVIKGDKGDADEE